MAAYSLERRLRAAGLAMAPNRRVEEGRVGAGGEVAVGRAVGARPRGKGGRRATRTTETPPSRPQTVTAIIDSGPGDMDACLNAYSLRSQ